MLTEFWLKIEAKKHYRFWESAGIPKVSKSKPTAGPNEVPIKVVVEIPDAYFEESNLKINIALPEKTTSVELTAEVADDIEDLLTDELGVKCMVSVETSEYL